MQAIKVPPPWASCAASGKERAPASSVVANTGGSKPCLSAARVKEHEHRSSACNSTTDIPDHGIEGRAQTATQSERNPGPSFHRLPQVK